MCPYYYRLIYGLSKKMLKKALSEATCIIHNEPTLRELRESKKFLKQGVDPTSLGAARGSKSADRQLLAVGFFLDFCLKGGGDGRPHGDKKGIDDDREVRYILTVVRVSHLFSQVMQLCTHDWDVIFQAYEGWCSQAGEQPYSKDHLKKIFNKHPLLRDISVARKKRNFAICSDCVMFERQIVNLKRMNAPESELVKVLTSFSAP